MTPSRDTAAVRLVTAAVGLWGTGFAASCMFLGDRVTSNQWKYLMSIPGGKWTWGIAFGVSGVCCFLGMLVRHWRPVNCLHLAAFGASGVGGCALLIAMFYLIAPFVVENMITLGAFPWVFAGSAAILVAAMNRNDSEW